MVLAALFIVALTLAGIAYSQRSARNISARFPNTGELIDIGGFRMNSVHLPATSEADLVPLVFIHGASGNLLDQMHAFAPAFEGRAEMLFVDRPGHGYSERGGRANDRPDGQADAIAKLMDMRGMPRAIIVGHSFGGAIAASFALRHPERTTGLILLAPATHPWPGGIDWYYRLTALPYVGWLFAHTLAAPIGLRRIDSGTRSVFSPNPRPADYIDKTAPHPRSSSAATATTSCWPIFTRAAWRATLPDRNCCGSATSATSPIMSSPTWLSPQWRNWWANPAISAQR
ncbi:MULTISPECIES: alpha/beta fold hydrolase [unclassified Ensifer]|uniref:alpha/beta fold hydrolase n=1 Tax=unclassified Ensifer TaxID=2633371 RepID=UPI000AD4D391|nr:MULTISPECIES: alpha/beta fold hydrolase [unclassified Ensifer]